MSRIQILFAVLMISVSGLAQYRWQAPPKDSLGLRIGIMSPMLFADIKDNKSNAAGTPIKFQPNSNRVEDYQFRLYYKYGTWDFFYQNYQGYYIENSSDI